MEAILDLQRREWIYQAYLLHPLVDGLDPKTHTVPLDIKKIGSRKNTDADAVACLLVGFDSEIAPMQEDVDRLKLLAGLAGPIWNEAKSHWPDDCGDHIRINAGSGGNRLASNDAGRCASNPIT